MTQGNPNKLPDEGFVRVSQIVKPYCPIPMSRAQWLQGVKDGRYPQPVKLSARITAWRVEDIRAFIVERITDVNVATIKSSTRDFGSPR